MTATSDVSDYTSSIQLGLGSTMAKLAGVSSDDVTLKVTSASVLLSYTIAAASSNDADALASSLSSQLSSTSTTTGLLGLDAYGFEALSIPTVSTSSSSSAWSSDDDCGGGCVAGATIGALLGAALIGYVGWRLLCTRSRALIEADAQKTLGLEMRAPREMGHV